MPSVPWEKNCFTQPISTFFYSDNFMHLVYVSLFLIFFHKHLLPSILSILHFIFFSMLFTIVCLRILPLLLFFTLLVWSISLFLLNFFNKFKMLPSDAPSSSHCPVFFYRVGILPFVASSLSCRFYGGTGRLILWPC